MDVHVYIYGSQDYFMLAKHDKNKMLIEVDYHTFNLKLHLD